MVSFRVVRRIARKAIVDFLAHGVCMYRTGLWVGPLTGLSVVGPGKLLRSACRLLILGRAFPSNVGISPYSLRPRLDCELPASLHASEPYTNYAKLGNRPAQ
jgi:hypothetical protein